MTDREKVNRALRNLRNGGFFVRIAWRRSYEAAWDEARDQENAVFYRKETDVDSFDENGRLKEVLFLQWNGDVREVVKALQGQGLSVDWDGSELDCIVVPSDGAMKKRAGTGRREDASISDIKESFAEHVKLMLDAQDTHQKLIETIGETPDVSTLIAVSRLYHSARLFFERSGGDEATVASFMDAVGQGIANRDLGMDEPCSCPKHSGKGQGQGDVWRYIR